MENFFEVSIIDIFIDIEKWFGLYKLFGLLLGNELCIDEFEKCFIIMLFCYGCNLGLV